jgi:hypothetical protein
VAWRGETAENTQNTLTFNPAANPAEYSALRHLWPGHPSGDRQQLNNSAKPESGF